MNSISLEQRLADLERLLQEKEARIAELAWYLGERDAMIASLEFEKKELANQLRADAGRILALRSELEEKRGLLVRIRNLEWKLDEKEAQINGLQFERAGLELRIQEQERGGLCR